MFRIFYPVTSLVAAMCCVFSTTFAQTAPADSSANSLTRQKLIANYFSAIGRGSGLYNGVAYDANSVAVKGSPYFVTPDWVNGAVIYDGVLYKNVPLKYDMFKDQFAALLYDHFNDYTLIWQRVGIARLNNHNFVTLPNNPDMEGYFDELYNGNSRLLVKRKMVVQGANAISGAASFYEYKTYYYVFANGKYNSVSDLGDVTSLFKPRKKEINTYLKQHNIKFKNNPEEALVSAVSYYDSINPAK